MPGCQYSSQDMICIIDAMLVFLIACRPGQASGKMIGLIVPIHCCRHSDLASGQMLGRY